jgi:hypothetical protein
VYLPWSRLPWLFCFMWAVEWESTARTLWRRRMFSTVNDVQFLVFKVTYTKFCRLFCSIWCV